ARNEHIHAFPCVGQVLHMIEVATGPPRTCRAVGVVDGVDHALQVAVAGPEGHLEHATGAVDRDTQLLRNLLDEVHVQLSGHAFLVITGCGGEDPVRDGLESAHGPPFGVPRAYGLRVDITLTAPHGHVEQVAVDDGKAVRRRRDPFDLL